MSVKGVMTIAARANLKFSALLLFACWACLGTALFGGCQSYGGSDGPAGPPQEFVGTTPCDTRSSEFVGGLQPNQPCHSITWHLTLVTNHNGGTYSLVANYGLPGRDDPNQIEPGPQRTVKGTWKSDRGRKADPQALVYRLQHPDGNRSLSVARVGEHLLHFLADDKSLMVGNAGWSYTLNRKGLAREN